MVRLNLEATAGYRPKPLRRDIGVLAIAVLALFY